MRDIHDTQTQHLFEPLLLGSFSQRRAFAVSPNRTEAVVASVRYERSGFRADADFDARR